MINKLMAGVQLAKMEQSDLDTNNFGKKAKVIFYGCNEQVLWSRYWKKRRKYGSAIGKKESLL